MFCKEKEMSLIPLVTEVSRKVSFRINGRQTPRELLGLCWLKAQSIEDWSSIRHPAEYLSIAVLREVLRQERLDKRLAYEEDMDSRVAEEESDDGLPPLGPALQAFLDKTPAGNRQNLAERVLREVQEIKGLGEGTVLDALRYGYAEFTGRRKPRGCSALAKELAQLYLAVCRSRASTAGSKKAAPKGGAK